MTEHFPSGWDCENENQAYSDLLKYQEFCGERFLYDFAGLRGRIYDEAEKRGAWSLKNLPVYNVVQNKTNGCVSYSAAAAIDVFLDFAMQRGREVAPFRSYPIWLYGGYHNAIMKRPGSGGCTLFGMMQFLYQHGTLPQDTPGLPQSSFRNGTYIDGSLNWNSSTAAWKEAYEKFGPHAVQLRPKVARMPRQFNDVKATLRAGYPISYGTDLKLVKGTDGVYRINGKTAHAMTWFGMTPCGQFTYNWNSWNDNVGRLALSDVQKQLASRYWDGWMIFDIERGRPGNQTWV
jgi:hypothetical protein